jgi:hypothetical protein
MKQAIAQPLKPRRALVISLVVIGALLVVHPGQARPASGITGTWNCCGGGGAAAQNFIIRSTGTTIHGVAKLPSGRVFATITGTLNGRKVKLVTTYNKNFSPGYIATFTGTLNTSRTSMAGAWRSNANQRGTWTATRH